jgi:hypothetical protein
LIGGQNDRITAPAASRALAQALPDARYVEMHRAAHAPFLSHRKEFAALVDNFLRGAVARPAAKAQVRHAKKKRIKARVRKKLKASSR